MIKTLRFKFLWIAMLSVFLVLSAIIGIANIMNYYQVQERTNQRLQFLVENKGKLPERPQKTRGKEWEKSPKHMSPELPFELRYFTILMGEKEQVISIDTRKIAAISTKEAEHYAQEVAKKSKKTGFYKQYKYTKIQDENGELYIFLDCSRELEPFYSFCISSIVASVVGMIGVFLLLLWFSNLILKPVTESYEKQKRFITDVSHEIKTPLTIIHANAEVLEIEQGENAWLTSIKNQVNRLTNLTEKLIFLSKMEEEMNVAKKEFSVSNLAKEVGETFQTVAMMKEKEFQMEVQQNISYFGEENSIRQLFSLLLDNAIKYSTENGKIVFSVEKKDKKLYIQIKNTTNGMNIEEMEQLFERFYRIDSSRNSKTGGYGIGLSIVKAIVSSHKGTIKVKQEGNWIVFSCIL